ncbi:MAG: DUF695 domain-containing protein [Candidatus Aphodosoma sp.]
MKLTDKWFSTMGETDDGHPIFITGRDDLDEFQHSGKLKERVEIYWQYTPAYNAMPANEDGKLMDEVQGVLRRTMECDKLAILTGIYVGGGERTLVFYTRTARVFGERLNEALAPYPTLPIKLYVENDPDWCEYREMCEIRPFAE